MDNATRTAQRTGDETTLRNHLARHGWYRWIIQTACASMPRSCWGRYGRVAILELEADYVGDRASMISERAKGVRQIISLWDKKHVGSTENSAYFRCLAEAKEELAEHEAEATKILNGEI